LSSPAQAARASSPRSTVSTAVSPFSDSAAPRSNSIQPSLKPSSHRHRALGRLQEARDRAAVACRGEVPRGVPLKRAAPALHALVCLSESLGSLSRAAFLDCAALEQERP